MNLTPEELQTGKENFYAAIGSEYTRRDFLAQSLAAAAVAGGSLGGFYYGYSQADVKDPVRIGVIGTGDEGNVLIGALNPNFLQVKAICDIRPYNVYRAFEGQKIGSERARTVRKGLMNVYGWKTRDEAEKKVKVYQDWKLLIDEAKDTGIEAIVIGLPFQLHAPVAVYAMERGLHVLTEKLMSSSIGACKDMIRTAVANDCLLSVGHQRHYNILYANAAETISSGLLGDIHFIRAQWHRGNLPGKDSWQPMMPGDPRLADALRKRTIELERATAPGVKPDPKKIEDLQNQVKEYTAQVADKDVDAAKYGYQDHEIPAAYGLPAYQATPLEELIRWRLWKRTGGGLMVELGSHQMDAAGIFVTAMHEKVKGTHEKVKPLAVSAHGARNLFNNDREIDDHLHCIIEFPHPEYDEADPQSALRKIEVAYSAVNGNGFGGYGEEVYGTKGTLMLLKEQEVALFKEADTSAKVEVKKSDELVLDTQASGPSQAAAKGAAALADVSLGYREELEHWAWCIRNRAPENQPRCNGPIGMADAVIALTVNVAVAKQERIEFKKEWFDYTSDETPDDSVPTVKQA